jgi:hypothetical protein
MSALYLFFVPLVAASVGVLGGLAIAWLVKRSKH